MFYVFLQQIKEGCPEEPKAVFLGVCRLFGDVCLA